MIRRLDQMIVKELLGPWLFGVGMFTALLVAMIYLGHLTGYLATGVPAVTVFQLTAVLLPGVIVKTFSMAMLLSGLLSFGRLSSDSEIVALRASGASLFAIMRPVMVFSLVVAIMTFATDEAIVPPAARYAVKLESEIARLNTGEGASPGQFPYIKDKRLTLSISAQQVDVARMQLRDAAIVAFDSKGKPYAVMTADLIEWAGTENPKRWLIPSGAHITSLTDPKADIDIKGVMWPDEMPVMDESFADLVTIKDDNFDATSLTELWAKIQMHAKKGDKTAHDMANYEYGFYNKFALPLAGLIFGTLGAVLGIRNHRTGTAAGFALAVGIIFGYFTLVQFMAVWVLGGVLPAWAASFTPPTIGLVASGVIMWRRNT